MAHLERRHRSVEDDSEAPSAAAAAMYRYAGDDGRGGCDRLNQRSLRFKQDDVKIVLTAIPHPNHVVAIRSTAERSG